MKAFLAGCVVAVLIAAVAGVALQWVDWSAQATFQSETGNVRP
jgi:hypothetical protein